MERLSTIGAAALVANSFSPFGLYMLPEYLQLDKSAHLLALVLGAGLSYLASHFLIALTDLQQHERIGSGLNARLLSVPSEKRREMNIPALVRADERGGCWESLLSLLVLYCSLLCVLDFGLLATFALRTLTDDSSVLAGAITGLALLIAALNRADQKTMEIAHIAMAVCRLLVAVSLPVLHMPWKFENSDENFLLPTLLTAFLYQLPLPGILTAYSQPLHRQRMLQVAVIAVYACLYAAQELRTHLSPLDPGSTLRTTLSLLFIVSALATSQLHLRTFGQIILAWFYPGRIELEREQHPRKVNLIETWLHLPLYLLYVLFLLLGLTGPETMLLVRFRLYMAAFAIVIYFQLVYAYKRKLTALSNEEIGSYSEAQSQEAAIAWMCVCGGVMLLTLWVVFSLMVKSHEVYVAGFFPNSMGFFVLVALIVLKRLHRL